MRVGVLLSGAPGVAPALVVVIGAGAVGTAALRMAVDAGAQVTVLNKGLARLQTLDILFGGRITTIASTSVAIDEWVSRADLVVGAALVPGAAAPKLVGRGTVAKMREGSVVVDVAIDKAVVLKPVIRPRTLIRFMLWTE